MSAKVAVIGAGFSGLAAAAYLAKAGLQVSVFEKNHSVGGRARQFSTDNGFVFDMGPSWYWMPDIFEDFFNDFGSSVAEHYSLTPLDPQFEMVFDDEVLALPSDYQEMRMLFEKIESGSARQLDRFMEEAKFKYEVGMKDFVHKPCLSWTEFLSPVIMKNSLRLDLLTSFHSHVRKYFHNRKLLALMEFPVIFLGAMPRDIPALYSLMNYGGYSLKTWYPQGGFIKIIEGMRRVAEKCGAQIYCGTAVNKINTKNNQIHSLIVNGQELPFDAALASADYHHAEQLLDPQYRNYNDTYWEKKVFAPSCLIFYLGIDKKLDSLKHHTLFFEHDLDLHAREIYKDKGWPTEPLFYVCCPSKTDPLVAPPGMENLFMLMPLAPGLQDTDELRNKYFKIMLRRLEKHLGMSMLDKHIVYQRAYCIKDFISDYNAFKGNAYGLANTLMQTAVFKPSIRNKRVTNLFYSGQLTVPGPGVPPSLISGKVVAKQIIKDLSKKYEAAF